MIDPTLLAKFTHTCVFLFFSFFFSFWGRGIPDCGPGAQARFRDTMSLFFEAVNRQARAREQNIVPDLESYIDIRRDTSGEFNSKRLLSIDPITNFN
jgi:hypothetical protein